MLTLTDGRAQSARAAPGVTLVDSSETGAPVRELIWPSVLGEPLVVCLQEPMPGKKSLEYVIQATASVWMPFEQVHNVVSGDVEFDSFGMAPWDAGGMHDDRCQLREALQTMMLQWLMRLLCRPVIMHGLDRTRTMNTENGLDTILMITTDSPRLAVTPGEWYASSMLTLLSRDLRRMNGAMYNSRTERGFPQVDSAAADSGVVELDDLIFRRLSLPPEEVSAGREPDFPPHEFAAGRVFRRAERRLYMARPVDWAVSMYRSVTGSLSLGSPHRLGRCCLWLAALPFRWTGSAEVPLSHHLLPAVSRRTSQEDDTPFHSHLCQVHPRDSCMDFLAPCFRLILTFSYCLYDFLREQELGTGGSPITDKADSFHGQIRWEKIKRFCARQSRCQGTMGCQASRDTCEGDMRL